MLSVYVDLLLTTFDYYLCFSSALCYIQGFDEMEFDSQLCDEEGYVIPLPPPIRKVQVIVWSKILLICHCLSQFLIDFLWLKIILFYTRHGSGCL